MIRVHLTLPVGISLLPWADAVALDMDPYGATSKLLDETKWQDWGVQFLNNTTLGRNLPNPYNFNDWRDWAERFVQALA